MDVINGRTETGGITVRVFRVFGAPDERETCAEYNGNIRTGIIVTYTYILRTHLLGCRRSRLVGHLFRRRLLGPHSRIGTLFGRLRSSSAASDKRQNVFTVEYSRSISVREIVEGSLRAWEIQMGAC